MQIRYYLSWFDDKLPEKLVTCLKEDLSERQSLVMISGQPSSENDPIPTFIKEKWLATAGITFEEYHLLDYRMDKEIAHDLLKKASVIFLCGGYPLLQKQFLISYELNDVIKNSEGLVMGASAGGINMSRAWLCSRNTGMDVESSQIYPGIALDAFFFCSKPQLTMNDTAMLEELLPLSQELPIYVASNEAALRIKKDKVTTFGEIHLMCEGQIKN